LPLLNHFLFKFVNVIEDQVCALWFVLNKHVGGGCVRNQNFPYELEHMHALGDETMPQMPIMKQIYIYILTSDICSL